MNFIEDTTEPRLIPVTLLSGFLGAGKTSLLQHILRNKENLRCAVIVNDMASLNIDAALVSQSEILHRDEKMISMQNGCICCTLREDLLVEITRIAKSQKFDYIIIESTGISEPMQVAETFVLTSNDLKDPYDASEGITSLEKLARLDTCVTVVDAMSIFGFFENSKFIAEEFANEDNHDHASSHAHAHAHLNSNAEGDAGQVNVAEVANPDRTVVDLLIDQIEFSNVIILNKKDCVTAETLAKAISLLKRLNPKAEIIPTNFSQVPLQKVLNTKKFDYDTAAASPGWLLSLQELHVPETEEYGIGSFVYRRRRPFHPQRLFNLVVRHFMVLEYGNDDSNDEDEEDSNTEDSGEHCEDFNCMDSDEDANEDSGKRVLQEDAIRERLAAKKASVFANLFRSKGFFWLATRPDVMGEWAQAGTVLSVQPMRNWTTSLMFGMEKKQGITDVPMDVAEDTEDWKKSFATAEECQGNAEEAALVGDRRQELVFIGDVTSAVAGVQMERETVKDEMIGLLDACLVTDEEWIAVREGMVQLTQARVAKLAEIQAKKRARVEQCQLEGNERKRTSVIGKNTRSKKNNKPIIEDEHQEEEGDEDEDSLDDEDMELDLPEALQQMDDPWDSWDF